MKKQTKPKKRNPPDATLRNITALKKRVSELEIIALRHRCELNECKRAFLAMLDLVANDPRNFIRREAVRALINVPPGFE